MNVIPVDISRESQAPHLFFRIFLVLILYIFILSASLLRFLAVPLFEVSLLCFAQIFLSSLYLVLGRATVFTTYVALTIDSIFISLLIFLLSTFDFPPFLILYALIILYAGLVLYKTGGIWISIVSVLGYLAVWYWHYSSIDPSTIYEERNLFQLLTTGALMLLVGYSSGALGTILQEKSDQLWQAYQNLDWQKSQIEAMNWKISEQNDELMQANEALKEAKGKVEDYAKNLENKVEEQTRMLIQSEKMASVGNLVAGVSHEMGSPLNVVSFLVHRLKEVQNPLRDLSQRGEPSTSKELEEIADITVELESSFNAMYSVVQGLKEFAHRGSGKKERVDLHRSLDTVYRMVAPQYKGKVEMVKEYGEVPEVWGILAELNQAFINFLSNACQSIPDGKGGRVVIRTWLDGEWVKVSIQDNGSGIPPEDLSRIFDPYFTTKPMGQGLGLGLAITFQVIQRHQGRIEVKSEINRGTEFVVSLPAAKEA